MEKGHIDTDVMGTGGLALELLTCDGGGAPPDSLPNHVILGVSMLIWGMLMYLSMCWRQSLGERDSTAPPFFSRTWEPLLPFLPSKRWKDINARFPLDSLCKIFFATLLLIIWYPLQTITCSDGVRAGRIEGLHVPEWAYGTVLVAGVFQGLIELLALRVRLPPSTPTATMVVGHLLAYVLFTSQQKRNTLDEVVQHLLGGSFLLAALAGSTEILAPLSFLSACGKLFFHNLGAVWMIVSGYILFGGSPFWAPMWNGAPDMTPAMFVPLLYALMILGLLTFMLLVYAAVDFAAMRTINGAAGGGGGGGAAAAGATSSLVELPLSGKRGAGEKHALLATEDPGDATAVPIVGGGSGYDGYGLERRGAGYSRVAGST